MTIPASDDAQDSVENTDEAQDSVETDKEGDQHPLLVDFSHENEPDISISSFPQSASISEIWGPYPYKPKCQVEWDNKISQISNQIADINPYVKHKLPGEEIAAIDAVNWVNGQFGQVDFRPKLYDNITKSYILCDTGAMISCVPKEKGDILDPNTTLRTADGKPMRTYGSKEISVRMGRKTFSIQAVITEVNQKILGMDFFRKYRLGFEWYMDDLYVIDRKAQIWKKLKFVTIAENSLPTVSAQFSMPQNDPKITAFEINCVKQLNKTVQPEDIFPELKPNHQDQVLLKTVPEVYRKLIEKFDILTPNYKVKPKHGITHRIETGDNTPATSKVRPIPADLLPQVVKMFKEMEAAGVISRVNANSNTKWSNALHVVRKNGSKPRICGDYRLLNSKIVCDSYPLPLMRDISQKLHGARVFTKIDLKKAYWNIPLQNKHKSTLVTPFGAFYFNRLPFGVASAPASYQKAMDTIFQGIPNLYIYMDDLLIFNEDHKSHEKIVSEVLERLHQNGMAISLSKCVWQADKVEYLGYSISENGLKPLPKKLSAIANIAPPKKQKDLLGFLGAANFYRRSLSGLNKNNKYYNTAALIQCLYDIATEKNLNAKKFEQKWNSDPKYSTAFNDAKKLINNAANLVHLNPNAPLALFVDASDVSIGGKLCQLSNKGWQAIGYYSKSLNDSQKLWSVFNKELHSLHLSIRHFLHEILGRNLTCFTDHKAVSDAFKRPEIKQNDGKAARKLLEISQFTSNVHHISGSQNSAADFLSRYEPLKKTLEPLSKEDLYQPFYPLMEDDVETNKVQTVLGTGSISINAIQTETVELQAEEIKSIAKAQETCPETIAAKTKQHSKFTKFAEVSFGDYKVVCELSATKPRPILPAELRNYYMKTLHSIGHPSIKETIYRLSSNYYWSKLSSEVTKFVQQCHQCLSTKTNSQKQPHIGQFEVPEDRFSHLQVDIIELPVAENGCKYAFTVICRTSRYFSAYAMQLATSENCMKGLLDFISHFGIPKFLSSDSGTQFLSSLWKKLESTLGIELRKGALYRPQTVGMVERSHRTFKDSLKAQILDFADKNQKNWPDLLPWALLSMRASYRDDIEASPSELAHGLKPALPGSLLINSSQPSQSIKDILKTVTQKTNRAPVQTHLNVPNHTTAEPPPDATHVYTRQHKQYGLDPPFKGPFKILKRLSRSTVRIKVGTYADGSDRYEDRFWGDLKAVKLDNVKEEERPKLGRPKQQSIEIKPTIATGPPKTQPFSSSKKPHPEYIKKGPLITEKMFDSADWPKILDIPKETPPTRPIRSTRNPEPNYINTITNPQFQPASWSASSTDLKIINNSIGPVRCEARG